MVGRNFWDISPIFNNKPPIFLGKLKCPICNCSEIFFKNLRVLQKDKGQYRIDLSLKCKCCAYVMTFGIHINEDEYLRLKDKILSWKDVGHRKI